MDIRATPQWAQVCAIHWQVAQATSLENIHFYMTKPEDDPSTTQQVGSILNGFLSDEKAKFISFTRESTWKTAAVDSYLTFTLLVANLGTPCPFLEHDP
jgi:hypothetical protein